MSAMKRTHSSQRRSRGRNTDQYSRRDGASRSRSPIRRNRQRQSNSRERKQTENQRQLNLDTLDSLYRYNETATWSDSRSYASCSSSGQKFLGRQYEMERNEQNNYEGGYESDIRRFSEDTRTFDETSRRQNIPHSPVICKFYNNEGECSRGNSCIYLHLCRHYISGSCKYGRICKRSHNISDRQPMQILKQYGLIRYSYTSGDDNAIIRFINMKEKSNNGKLKFEKHTISKSNLKRPLLQPVLLHEFDIVNETASLYESKEDSSRRAANYDKLEQLGGSLGIAVSDIRPSDGLDHSSQSEVDTSVDYIPLERKTKKKLTSVYDKKKKRKNKYESRNKMKDCKVEMVDAPEEGPANNIDGQMIPAQSTMKFELHNWSQHFQVRSGYGRFQIAAMPEQWEDMNITDSEIFGKLYHSAVQIRKKFLPKP